MKKVLLHLFCCILGLWGAQEGDYVSYYNKKSLKVVGELSVGVHSYTYTEPNVMSISGPMMSFEGSVGVSKGLFRFAFDGYFSTHLGANLYSGGLYDPITKLKTPYQTQSEDYYFGFSPRFGMSFFQGNKEIAFLYSGLGYRYLHNMMQDQPGIKASYERNQGYLYFLIGAYAEIPIQRMFSFFTEVQYRQLLYGHQFSGMKALGYDEDFYFTQKQGNGVKINLGGKVYFKEKVALKLALFYEFWGIDESNRVDAYMEGKHRGVYVEPRNHTHVFGGSIGATF